MAASADSTAAGTEAGSTAVVVDRVVVDMVALVATEVDTACSAEEVAFVAAVVAVACSVAAVDIA